MRSPFSVLADPEYRKYALAAILTTAGGAMYFVAMAWFLYQLTDSAASVGVLLIISTLPGMLLSPWIGVLVDRWPSQTICVVSDLVRGAVMGAVALAMWCDLASAPLLYGATFLIAVCDNFFQPAVAALVRNTVDQQQLLAANAMSSTSIQLGGLAGAGVGGVLVAWVGASPVVLGNAASFLVSAALTASIVPRVRRAASAGTARKPGLLAEFRTVLPYIANHGYIIRLAVLQLFVFLTLAVCNTLLAPFIDKVLHSDAAGFGLIDAAWGAGAMTGGLAISSIVARVSRQQFGVASLFLLALAGLVFASAGSVLHGMLGYFLLGFLCCAIRINSDTILVSEVAVEYFGKVKACIAMVVSCISIVIYGCVGYLGDLVDLRYVFAMLSGLTLLSGAALLAWSLRSTPTLGKL